MTEQTEQTEESVAVEEDEERGVMSAQDLAAVREVVLRAYPETVPELVGGASVAEVLGSVEAAAAAYQRIAAGVAARPPTPAAPVVPAGSAPPLAVDAERLPSVEKIRRGLAARR